MKFTGKRHRRKMTFKRALRRWVRCHYPNLTGKEKKAMLFAIMVRYKQGGMPTRSQFQEVQIKITELIKAELKAQGYHELQIEKTLQELPVSERLPAGLAG